MAKNRYFPAKQTPSPAPAHTIDAVVSPFSQEDDEDNDICPVCDGECTCDIKPRALSATPPTIGASHGPSASRSNHSSSSSPPPPKQARPSLKIKLTVPQSLLGKRRAPPSSSNKSKSPAETIFASEFDGDYLFSPENPLAAHQPPNTQSLPVIQPKRRGRPPKAVVAARALAARLAAGPHEASTLPSPVSKKHDKRSNARHLPTEKKSTAKRRRVASRQSSDKSDVDHRYDDDDDDDDDAQSGRFPTFISASALSSRASSSSESDSSSLCGFDSDSSMEAEEEEFILSEMHNRARVRRELLDEEVPKKNYNTWIIRPRQNSVGPDDGAMDLNSDVTDEEEEEEEEEECEDDAEDTDGMAPGGYIGMATGWSDDDDESSFDADLFFANLSDSENGSSTVDDDGGDDGDQSDLESTSFREASMSTPPPRPHHDSFEVTEGWDGQIVFTNGLSEGQGILDMDFEATAAQFTVETSASPSQESDAEMSTNDINDAGYEEDADGGEGDTTDEELVGDDDLPNERAMRLFSLPSSVSAINPMSTMSPTVSPGPRDRKPFSSRGLESPKPADILSGKFFWDSDDHDEYDSSTPKSRSQSSFNSGPRAGHFEPAEDSRRAIIDDSHHEIPSPHPRYRRNRETARFGNLEHIMQKHVFAAKLGPMSNHSSLQLLSSADHATHASPAAEIVDLNEVLEASFLDTEAPDPQSACTEVDSHKQQLKGINRWDVISVGAFRRTRGSGAITDGTAEWSSDAPPSAAGRDYGKMMKSSPLSTMLWQNKGIKQKRSRKMSVIVSPVILPVRDREGDHTPTDFPPNYVPPYKQNNHPHKSRKELRRERKLQRKSCGPVPHHHQHPQRHFHQHHPNSKTRSTSSTQRMNSSSSSIPPLNL